MLCQELVRDDPWQVLVVCFMLNCTTGTQVRRVFPEFFHRWPAPADLLAADPEEVKQVICSLGFKNRRYERIRRMSEEFLRWDGRDARDLYGVGQYAADSYTLFVEGVLPREVQDKELRRFCQWARGLPNTEADGHGQRQGHVQDHDRRAGV